jgi:hypothetical protein
LVHVLIADEFPTTAPPKWAEEGLALLMDSAQKRTRHERDLKLAIGNGSLIPITRLLADRQYPVSRRAEFYGQSLALVEYLTALKPREKFVEFVRLAVERDSDHALAVVYGTNAQELDRCLRIAAAR